MKNRTLVLIPIFIFVVVAIFIFASCDTTGNGAPTFVGTWVTPDNEKLVVTDTGDGTFTCVYYENVSDTEPSSTLIMTVIDEWTDSEGNLFYKIDSTYPDPAYVYMLIKIHADNQTMEMNLNDVDYPPEIDPAAGEDYVIYYRQ